MNFYKNCAGILAKLEEKRGSIKSLVGTLSEKDRKRGAALVIETLKCEVWPCAMTEFYSNSLRSASATRRRAGFWNLTAREKITV
jgi:hypothetical protein